MKRMLLPNFSKKRYPSATRDAHCTKGQACCSARPQFLELTSASPRLAKLVEDSWEGYLSVMDYSDAAAAANGEEEGESVRHRVLVLDEFSASRPMFLRDPEILRGFSPGTAAGGSQGRRRRRWTALVAMVPRQLVPELVKASAPFPCAECREDACRARKGSMDRVCICCWAGEK